MIFEVILFILLSPGLFLTLPPVGKSFWMTMKTSIPAIFLHAFIFGVLLYFKKYLPIVGSYEGFADASGGSPYKPKPEDPRDPQLDEPIIHPSRILSRNELLIRGYNKHLASVIMKDMADIFKSVPRTNFNKIAMKQKEYSDKAKELMDKAMSVKCD